MRTAMLLNDFPVLSEKFLVNQIAGLVEAGHRPDIITTRLRRGLHHAAVDRYGLMEGVMDGRMPDSARARLLAGAGTILSNLVASPAKTLAAQSRERYRTAATNGKNQFLLKAVRGREPVDILHAHFGPNGLAALFLRDIGFARKVIVTFHGSDINTYPGIHGEHVYDPVWEGADLVTANTRFTAGKMTALGCPAHKVRILPVGLSIPEYTPPEPGTRLHSTILTVARLVHKKGHRHAIDALALLAPRYPELRWVFAGDGPLRQSLEAQVRNLGLEGRVTFLGRQTDTEVTEWYRKATLSVLPSVTGPDGDMEGQGLVLQEAQACGLPVVSTLHNGIPDGVLDGKTGFLVPEGDAEALAECIALLLDDPARASAMGQAGREFVAGRYDMPILSRSLLDIYREALEGISGNTGY